MNNDKRHTEPVTMRGGGWPVGSGKPDRDDIISKDDITDLKIDLGRAKTVEAFLKTISK
jgi:hypothetical protein